MRLIAILFALVLSVCPGLAAGNKTLYLVQQPNDTCATRITDVQPVAGTNCPAGSFTGIWTQSNNDQYPGDYVWSSGSSAFIYSPPTPPVAAPAFTTVSGTQGNLFWTEDCGAASKKITIVLTGFVAPSIQGVTVTFPVAFLNAPAVTANTTGLSITTITTATVKIPSGASSTGTITLEGI